MNILELARHEKNLVVGLRRYFHENPELSQKEFKTMDFIEKKLNGWGIETVRIPHGGIFGVLDSGKLGGRCSCVQISMRFRLMRIPVI